MVSLRTVGRAYAGVEMLALILAVFVAPPDIREKSTHFTWWGIGSLVLFDAVALWSPPGWRERTFAFFAGTAFTILVGVLGLSVARCTLLSDALDEMGFGGYVAGNLAIHYWPAARVMMHAPQTLVRGPNQALAAASYLVLYLSVNRASKVYGCSLEEWTVVIFGCIGVGAAQFLRTLSNRLEVIAHTPDGPELPEHAKPPTSRASGLYRLSSVWLVLPAVFSAFPSVLGYRLHAWTIAPWFALAAAATTALPWPDIDLWTSRLFAAALAAETVVKLAMDWSEFWPALIMAPIAAWGLATADVAIRTAARGPAVVVALLLAGAPRKTGSAVWGWAALGLLFCVHLTTEGLAPPPADPEARFAAWIRGAGFAATAMVFIALAWT